MTPIPFSVFKTVVELTDDYRDEDVVRLLTFTLARKLLLTAGGDNDLLAVRVSQTVDLIESAIADLLNNPDSTQAVQ